MGSVSEVIKADLVANDEYQKSVSASFKGEDFEGAVEQLSQVFGQFDGEPIGDTTQFSWSTDINSCGGLVLVSGHYGGEWDLWPLKDTPEMLSIVRSHQGAMRTFLGSNAVESSKCSLLLANNLEAGRYALRGDTNVSDALFIDWTIVAQTVVSLFDRPLHDPLCLMAEVNLSGSIPLWIANLVDLVSNGMRMNGPLLQSPLAATNMAAALANLIVVNVPNRFSQFIEKTPASAAPRQVKEAVDYMHQHIARPITIQSIAQAIGVSSRSLELSFRSFKGVTPAAYLREIRLQAVHAELCDPSSTVSIKDICLKWGFFHLGRFSALYRGAYGLSPSEMRRKCNEAELRQNPRRLYVAEKF